ncbi:hypothetical protein KY329_02235 [Candidatus Woesearchaeota archaeon]|nr:hypothetical protein [Candidatus Woesearchaeota archaeon]
MDYRSKILAMVRSAPVLPTQVAKALGTDSLMSGAMLSEMVSKGMLKVSKLKVGGSPVYYAPDSAAHLLNFLSVLNDKDKAAVELLKKEGILRDADQSPLVRACLANVKDFAQPLKVVYQDKEELFWKFSLLSDKDAEDKIRAILNPKEKKAEPKVEKPAKESQIKLAEPKKESEEKKNEPKPDKPVKNSGFISAVEQFFSSNSINVIGKSVVKKDDADFILSVPSPVGSLHYFCKVKGKKRINDSDLSSALVSGQLEKLPVMFIYTGELSKSAKELLPKLKGFVAKRL